MEQLIILLKSDPWIALMIPAGLVMAYAFIVRLVGK